MGQIARLATFATAAVLTLLVRFLPGLRLVPLGTGRLPGGLAKLASLVALVLVAAIAVSSVQELRRHRSPALRTWTALAAAAVALLVLGVLGTHGARAGVWVSLAACALAVLASSGVLDRLEAPPLVETVVPPQPVAVPPRRPTALVRAAEIGHAGLRITTDAGAAQVVWADLVRVQLITGLEPGVELTTRDAIVRFTRKTEADYRFLPGTTDGSAAANLRRLYEYARERNPSLRLTP